ncbi:MAG: type VI secretion system baseplate subunit TssE [Planctomycetota bacterium]|jgi:type VI secretion system lysozyme-like protein|nr:type VI secretion system baseplate subunit TssE [Planctomycetota bacterium]
MALSGIGGRGKRSLPRPLLDRFLRDENGRHLPATTDAEEWLAVIRRDVETLLNTRSPVDSDSDADSVVGYGLPDFTHLSPDSPDDRWRMAAAVREALRRFETRLENIRVELGDDGALFVAADVKAVPGQLEFTLRPKNF